MQILKETPAWPAIILLAAIGTAAVAQTSSYDAVNPF